MSVEEKPMDQSINQLTVEIQAKVDDIRNHGLYKEISDISQLQFFMEQHVFAVWDFMCLLKELHNRLVSTRAPWFPPKDAMGANLISSILVEEEGDLAEDGVTYISHYDLYLESMKKIGANTNSINSFLEKVREGLAIGTALQSTSILPSTRNFVESTFSFFTMKTHELAAAFVYGREALTTEMFIPLVKQLRGANLGSSLNTLIYYLERHIQLDSDEHFPKALQLLSNLIGEDEVKWRETKVAALHALDARKQFLSGVQAELVKKQAA